jgi:hypothetical protein
MDMLENSITNNNLLKGTSNNLSFDSNTRHEKKNYLRFKGDFFFEKHSICSKELLLEIPLITLIKIIILI